MDQSSEKVVLHEGDVQRALMRIAHEIPERNPQAVGDLQDGSRNGASHATPDLAIVGIHRRGAFLAHRLRTCSKRCFMPRSRLATWISASTATTSPAAPTHP